jgi:DNA-directed RNA polymerase specialized sigma24 family protein
MDQQTSARKIDPLLLPFLRTIDEVEARLLLSQLIELAAPMIKRVTGYSQDPGDAFQESAQRLIERLWDFKTDPDGKAIGNYFHYVKVVASHVVKGQLRDKRRQRRSLMDALRHVLNGKPDFELWEDENRERLCGLAAWRHQPVSFMRSARLSQLLDDPHIFGEAALKGRDAQSMSHAELLSEIFRWVGHPVRYEDLVRIVRTLKRIEDFTSIDWVDEEDERSREELLPDVGPRPNEAAEWREFLGQLWAEIEQLPNLQRIAYLLNFTAGDGQLELFWAYGVVSIRGIGSALQLTADQFGRAWLELGLTDEERRKAEALTSYDEKFAQLWQYLPLTDLMIAKILVTERQKVINLRKAAGNRLSRRMARHSRAD